MSVSYFPTVLPLGLLRLLFDIFLLLTPRRKLPDLVIIFRIILRSSDSIRSLFKEN